MATGKCPGCGAAYGKGAKFCKRCGVKLLETEGADGGTEVLTEDAIDGLDSSPDETSEVVPEAPGSDDSPGTEADLFDDPECAAGVVPESGAVTLEIINGLAAGRKVRVDEGSALKIGAGADADLVLKDECVSQKHAALRVEGGKLFVEDLDSTNGTFLCITAPRELYPNDCLVLGNTLLRVGKE